MMDPYRYDPRKDGNVFEWILRKAQEYRESLEKPVRSVPADKTKARDRSV